MDNIILPLDLSPLNIKAYFYNALGICGCSDIDEVRLTLIRLLRWHQTKKNTEYLDLYPEIGIFYLLAGRLDDLGLAEHGTSIRYPWLTQNGEKLLIALEKYCHFEIDHANGEAYDGLWYGEF